MLTPASKQSKNPNRLALIPYQTGFLRIWRRVCCTDNTHLQCLFEPSTTPYRCDSSPKDSTCTRPSTKTPGQSLSLRPCPKPWNLFLQTRSLNPFYQKLYTMQFGSISGCSTVDELISMRQTWYANTDGNGKLSAYSCLISARHLTASVTVYWYLKCVS